MKLKILSLFLVVIVVMNLILFILRMINPLVFWLTIIISALIAYKLLPYLKIKEKERN